MPRPSSRVRVLVTSTPGAGHRQAVAPVAAALRDAGHDVLWATAVDGVDGVRSLGFETAVAGQDVAARREALGPEMPVVMAMPPRERRGHLFSRIFARGAAPVMRADLIGVVEGFAPDVVVHEVAELAAAPVARSRGIPHVTVGFAGAVPPTAMAMGLEAIAPVWRDEGLPAPTAADLAGDLYLHPFPPAFGQRPPLDVVRSLRPTGSATPMSDAPAWLDGFARERPGVYLTAGTEAAPVPAPWVEILAAVAELDVDAVATVGPHVDIGALGTVPSNVRVERFVPQDLLLDRASAVLSHGGAGSTVGAAARGLPQVVVPRWADQWENADAVTGAGVGVCIEMDQRSAADIHVAIVRVLQDPAFRDSAARVAAEIEQMPTADEHVASILALI